MYREYNEHEIMFFLSCFPGISSIDRIKLYNAVKPLYKIFEYDEDKLKKEANISAKSAALIHKNRDEIEKILLKYYKLSEDGIRLVCFYEKNYPAELKEIDNMPACIYVKGNLPKETDINKPLVAVVGSRDATNYGLDMTDFICSELASQGIEIISGMAYGIDAKAHRAGIKNNEATYAVLGNGIDICYPKDNYDIYQKLSGMDASYTKGGLISEFPLGLKPLPMNFPIRNRIISGLADLVIIMEAREKSGSLITASYAANQGKEVFALPGRISDTLSRGCNKLIFDGAGIITCIEDITDSLHLKINKKLPFAEKNIDLLANNEKKVYSSLDLVPKYFDDIMLETRLEYADTIKALLSLELKGYIRQISGNYYGRKYYI